MLLPPPSHLMGHYLPRTSLLVSSPSLLILAASHACERRAQTKVFPTTNTSLHHHLPRHDTLLSKAAILTPAQDSPTVYFVAACRALGTTGSPGALQ